MDTWFDRIEELRNVLGRTREQFCASLGLEKNNYSMWQGKQDAGKGTMRAISRRWFVSLDSLYAEEGTFSIEPAPALRRAQERMVLRLSAAGHTTGSVGERVLMAYRMLAEETDGQAPLLPTLLPEAWAEYLHWSNEDWRNATRDPSLIDGTKKDNPQLSGAAFVLGWYEARGAWESWFRTGEASELVGRKEELLDSLSDLLARRMLDRIDHRRLITEHSR